MSQPLISILMNCYNGDEYVRHALESVINQTYQNWEIIFWDNQSTDESANIVKQYTDPRIRYYLAPTHTTLGLARIRASDYLKGEWIAILDTDDYWINDNLETKVAVAESTSNIGIIYSRYAVDRSEIRKRSFVGPRLRTLPSGFQYKRLAVKNFISLNTVLYRKTAFDYVGGFNNYVMAADHDLSLRICKNYEIIGIEKVTSVYRVHKSNFSRSQVNIMYTERLKIAEKLDEVFLKKRAKARIALDFLHSNIGTKNREKIQLKSRDFVSLYLLIEIFLEGLERLYYRLSPEKNVERIPVDGLGRSES